MQRLPNTVQAEEEVQTGIASRPLELPGKGSRGEPTWRRNNASVAELSDKVVAFLEDQTQGGHLVTLTEADVESLPGLGDRRTNPQQKSPHESFSMIPIGLSENTRTRVRDQERSPSASDIKRDAREGFPAGVHIHHRCE